MFSFITDYKAVKAAMADIIQVSGYRNDYIADKMGISASSFAVKKQRNTWNEDEIEKMLTIIDNDEVENYIFLQILRSKKDEPTITSEEFKKEMGWS